MIYTWECSRCRIRIVTLTDPPPRYTCRCQLWDSRWRLIWTEPFPVPPFTDIVYFDGYRLCVQLEEL